MEFSQLYLWTGVMFSVFLSGSDANVTCLDRNGQPVDWFIVYKLPVIPKATNPLIREGVGHAYLDKNSQKWTLSDQPINSTKHAIYYTLQQIYDNAKSEEMAYIMYNDQPREHVISESHGHTKGDLLFNKASGFWLIHSIPHFPPQANETYGYPETGRNYGQTALCVSYPLELLNDIGKQLLFNYPFIFDYNVPKDFLDENPNIVAAIKGSHVKDPPWKNMITLTSLGGQDFTSFAKFTNFDDDLYAAWVAPYYQSDLYVETWQNGVGKLESNCSLQYKVYNLDIVSIFGSEFTETKDHSKWTVTTSLRTICIGDINRQEHQETRGGGTVCADLPEVWKAFNSSIISIENCPKSYPGVRDDMANGVSLV